MRKILKNNRVTSPLKITNKINSRYIKRTPFVTINGIKELRLSTYKPHYGNTPSRIYTDEEQEKSELLHIYSATNTSYLQRLQNQIDIGNTYQFYWNKKSNCYLFYHVNHTGKHEFSENECAFFCSELESVPGFYILCSESNDSEGDDKICFVWISGNSKTYPSGAEFYEYKVFLLKRSSVKERCEDLFRKYYYNIDFEYGLSPSLSENIQGLIQNGAISQSGIKCGIYVPFETISSQILHSYFPLENVIDIQDFLNTNRRLGKYNNVNTNGIQVVDGTWARCYTSSNTEANINILNKLNTKIFGNEIGEESLNFIVIIPSTQKKKDDLTSILTKIYTGGSVIGMPRVERPSTEESEVRSILTNVESNYPSYSFGSLLEEIRTNKFFIKEFDNKHMLDMPITIFGVFTSKTDPNIGAGICVVGTIERTNRVPFESPMREMMNINIPYGQSNSFGYRTEY